MRNILLFTSTFPKSADDPLTPRFVYHLGRELTQHHNVHVLAPHTEGAALEENLDGMQVIRFRYAFPDSSQRLAYGTGMTNNLREHPTAWLQVPSFFYYQRRALLGIVERFNIDVVNSHWMVPQGLVAAWSLNSPDVKHVLTVHSAGLFLLRRIPLGKRFARHILKHTDALYIVSENNHRMLEDLVRRPVKATIAPMGIHTEYYRQGGDPAELKQKLNLPQEGPIILFVGKLSRIKGVRFLLQAWPEVLKQFPAATLVIVGSGPEEAALKEAAGKLEEASRIRFVGQKNQEAVRDYLKVCDAVVIPSIQDTNGQVEGFPVVMLEALASGNPVVGTRLGGIPECIVDGENGYTVEPENPNAIAEGILKILQRGPQTFSEGAMASVKRFDWQTISEDYSKTFNDLFLGP
ncbi:MAG: glycosyltransferase family 4 protein [Candidatus Nitronauta litoralis]|uniref:Glycosyltransferase family 4 protein n=1 Tax=Candidatus Nitronauta litoralis TaxID=2705533 RepID=A0A7T0BUA9_9BACT|nr:MAG: glycosyltransferase family 4 protein [Candidatus Nitronauta litoralis]